MPRRRRLVKSADLPACDRQYNRAELLKYRPRRVDSRHTAGRGLTVRPRAERVKGFAMLLTSVERLQPGMCVAAPVLHPRQCTTRLVAEGMTLDAEMIARMKELGVTTAWVKHPLTADLDELLNNKVPETRRAIFETVKRGFDDLQNRVITVADYAQYRRTIADLVEELIGKAGRAGAMAERLFNDEENELAGHCANVAFLAVTVGMHLDAYVVRNRDHVNPGEARDLTSLGVGAILHDIGKLAQLEPLRNLHETGEDLPPEYYQHVVKGFEMLRSEINPVAFAIALHHHQRWDGAGWPDMEQLTSGRYNGGFSGRQIHIFARIVAAANVFDNLTSPPDAERRPAIFGLHQLRSNRFEGAFDPVVLDAFLRHVPPFPTGAEVILSDGRPAVVVGLSTEQPCRPTVRPLEDNEAGRDINLLDAPELFIRESQGVDVSEWLYTLSTRHEAYTAAMSDTVL